MYTRRILATLVAVLLVGACGDDPAPGATAADGGASANGAAVNAVCRDACANVAQCLGTPQTDESACSAQCGKELSGEGFLSREVAEAMFQGIAVSLDVECLPVSLDEKCEAKTRTQKCGAFYSYIGFGFGIFGGTRTNNFDETDFDQLTSQPKIVECAQNKWPAICPESSPELNVALCFDKIYRFHPSTVARLESCFASRADDQHDACFVFQTCLKETLDVQGQPWFGPEFASRRP